MLIEAEHGQLSVRRQCECWGSSVECVLRAGGGDGGESSLMRRMDEEYTKHPF